MSRLAKKPILIPQGVTLQLLDGVLLVKGAKTENKVRVPETVALEMSPEQVMVKIVSADKQGRADAGTVWSLIKNAIEGVTAGFGKVLEIEGVGYRAAVEGDFVVLSLGYVNPVKYPIPAGIAVVVEKNVIRISGHNKESVGQVAAQIRALKKPEPYKGKGIRYQGEVIRRKVGKKAATAGG